jgi:transcriptional regulator with XRE-family HTH domain
MPVEQEGLPMSFGERLRKRREELRVSQQDLSDTSGVRRATISDLETGKRSTVTTDTAKALARALGVSIDYLVGTWDDEAEPQPAGLAMVGA